MLSLLTVLLAGSIKVEVGSTYSTYAAATTHPPSHKINLASYHTHKLSTMEAALVSAVTGALKPVLEKLATLLGDEYKRLKVQG